MNTLEIGYDADTRECRLLVNGEPLFKSKIRAALDEVSDEVREIGDSVVLAPWWSFLQGKDRIAFCVRVYRAALTFSPDARALLQKAALEKAEAREHLRVIPADDVQSRLDAAKFGRRLLPYQLRNVSKLVGLPAGATFSVPGAGKTTEALAVFALTSDAESRLIVICPKNAFVVWEEQIGICLPSEPGPVVRLSGGVAAISRGLAENFRFAVISYQQVPTARDLLGEFLSTQRCHLYLDESHRIKRGESGVIGASILSIAFLAERRMILSGTPLPNTTADLLPQLQFLYPQKRLEADKVVEFGQAVYVRTTKSELRLPPLRRRLIRVPMSEQQAALYRVITSQFARDASGATHAQSANLHAIGKSALRMIQVVSNPALLANVEDETGHIRNAVRAGDSPKFIYAMRRARSLAQTGRKVLVWSSFVKNVEMLARRLVDVGAIYIHGGVETGDDTEMDTREEKIKRFHDDPNCMVLIANPAACGEGISLHTVCHHAIYVDRTYNASQYLQSEDRIHRIGLAQDQITNIEILATKDTVDDSVNRRLVAKAKRMGEVLNDHDLNIEPEYAEADEFGMNLADVADLVEQSRRYLGE